MNYAAFIIIHVPLKFQVSDSILRHHRLASFAAYPQINPVVWGSSIFFLQEAQSPMLQVSNSYLCRHCLASFAAYPQRNPVVWGPSIFFLAGVSEPDSSGLALSVLIND